MDARPKEDGIEGIAESQGRTEAEAMANIQAAIKAWLWAEDQRTTELSKQVTGS
jgi:predicted RNase H-like HicB family nuclease